MPIQKTDEPPGINAAYRRHERAWKDNLYVYPVVSRRSRGISIGINLNPGKECNFSCVYCQVDRRIPPSCRAVDPDRIRKELETILEEEKSGLLYESSPFNLLSRKGRGIRDIAFSGDGEPTASPDFHRAVLIAAHARHQFNLSDVKLVLITNASLLNTSQVRKALAELDKNNGEIWAKLDAGTEKYFREVNRARISLKQVVDNIIETARIRPLVIQTLWMHTDGAAPPDSEIMAYCECLNRILKSGGCLKRLQLYTIARNPAEKKVSGLSDEGLDRIADRIRGEVTIPVEVFYGSGA